jgi:ATP-dependent Clp protease protease subunit
MYFIICNVNLKWQKPQNFMPIGVPRIIYCWGEELPAQWTDIYNFIFRRRMVFLMQYLDDELCNQICGLLINIHMEDRSKELEKKEMEKSGLFKNTRTSTQQNSTSAQKEKTLGEKNTSSSGVIKNSLTNGKKLKSFEDLLAADEDLGIEENNTLEQFTLQKITMEWLNWNAQFFDYSDEPYLFYLAEMLSKDFDKGEARMLYSNDNNEMSILISACAAFKKLANQGSALNQIGNQKFSGRLPSGLEQNRNMIDSPADCSPSEIPLVPSSFPPASKSSSLREEPLRGSVKKNHLDVYSPFRLLANFAAQDYDLKDINSNLGVPLPSTLDNSASKIKLLELFNTTLQKKANQRSLSQKEFLKDQRSASMPIASLLTNLAQKNFLEKSLTSENLLKSSEKGLSQRILKKEYAQDRSASNIGLGSWPQSTSQKALNYLDFYSYKDSYNEFKNMQRGSAGRQAEKTLQEEEAKKVFVIINSFGGSVGNGITVHDALQFIKAGSLTLGLGVAASAASLALAGGTIGERYVTEGCHVMIHQPEGGIQGQASDIWIDSQEIMKIRLDVAEIYSLATYRPRHKILRDLDRDFYLTATETIHYGLADEIATNEVMHEIIEMTSKVWDYHDSKQQRLLESRESSNSGLDTQAQN